MLLVAAGFVGGLLLFGRGLVAYRRDRLIEAVATSRLDAIAAGEVRVSGTVEAVAMTLVSPLQSRPCVWYRARVDETGDNSRLLVNEERAQEFDLIDDTGRIRIVPRGARWEIGARVRRVDRPHRRRAARPPAQDRFELRRDRRARPGRDVATRARRRDPGAPDREGTDPPGRTRVRLRRVA